MDVLSVVCFIWKWIQTSSKTKNLWFFVKMVFWRFHWRTKRRFRTKQKRKKLKDCCCMIWACPKETDEKLGKKEEWKISIIITIKGKNKAIHVLENDDLKHRIRIDKREHNKAEKTRTFISYGVYVDYPTMIFNEGIVGRKKNEHVMEEKRKENRHKTQSCCRCCSSHILIWDFGFVCVWCFLCVHPDSVRSSKHFRLNCWFTFCVVCVSFSAFWPDSMLLLFISVRNRFGVSEFCWKIYYLVFTMCLFLSWSRRHVCRLIMLLLQCCYCKNHFVFGSQMMVRFSPAKCPNPLKIQREQYVLDAVTICTLKSIFAFSAQKLDPWFAFVLTFFRSVRKLTFFAYRYQCIGWFQSTASACDKQFLSTVVDFFSRSFAVSHSREICWFD